MEKSHVIEVNGVFVGTAVRHAEGFRFVAVDLRVGGINGLIAPTLDETRRMACSRYHLAKLPKGQSGEPLDQGF